MKIMKSKSKNIKIYKNSAKEKKGLLLDTKHFYNNVDFLDKLEEYFTTSRIFLKYIANTIVNFPKGYASIVEFSRSEEKIENFFIKMGYKETKRISKIGDAFKYKNFPIVLIVFNIEELQIEKPNERIKIYNNKSPELENIIELTCYCKESEKEFYKEILSDIKNSLSK